MALSNVSRAIFAIIGLSMAHNCVALIPVVGRLAYLIPHNIARAREHLPPVVWNFTLAEYAKSYAHERAADCALMHSTYRNPGYGENIAMSTGGGLDPATAVGLWVGEKPFYNYGANTCKDGEMCGHYTQVVWKDTKSIGCAKSRCQNGGTFLTCNYYPPGNYVGERPY